MYVESVEAVSPTFDATGSAVGESSCALQQRASVVPGNELERHIASCGYLMLSAYQRYEESSCLGDLGEAHRWKRLMEEAIKSRKPAQIHKLEKARGLA